jgi:hypothetical protein
MAGWRKGMYFSRGSRYWYSKDTPMAEVILISDPHVSPLLLRGAYFNFK